MPENPPARRRSEARPLSTALALVVLASLLGVTFSSSTARAAGRTLTILSPTNGAVIANGAPVVVDFLVSNFTLVQPGRVGQNRTGDEGYVNVFVDTEYVRLLTEVGPFSMSLASGPHTIRMQLNADNGSALNPDVSASVQVISTLGAAGERPRVTILSPTQNEATGHGIYVSYRIDNFTLVEPRGQPNAPNEGHVQILVEGDVVMEVIQYEPILVVSLPEGDITISVRLVNNDNTKLSPDASASVPIHVVASSSVSLPLIYNGGVVLLLAFILVVLFLRRRRMAARDPNPRGAKR